MGHNDFFRQYFDVRGIDIKDAAMFFQMLCASAEVHGGEVDVETFIGGCLRLKGLASSIDVQTLAFESKLMHCIQKDQMTLLEDKLSGLDERFEQFSGVLLAVKLFADAGPWPRSQEVQVSADNGHAPVPSLGGGPATGKAIGNFQDHVESASRESL